ncbi:MAG: L,D-transpeptidase, partial [Deltaproteobacteria bacterium]|nr:L,D-transpeptidase [Deltaproteobacteria bacterium]
LAASDALAPLGPIEPPPEFLPREGHGALEKPYGAARALRRTSGHSGRTSADAGFALLGAYEWEGRAFALTTELDLLPVDGLRVVRPSTVRGVALAAGQDLPVAIARSRFTPRYVERAPGVVVPDGTLEYREVLALTGRRVNAAGVTFLETPARGLVAEGSVFLVERRSSFPSVAEGRRRWIDVSIRDQTLVAYEGTRAAYVTLVSTGQAGLADPSRSTATVRGTFMIHAKHVTATMDGDEDRADSTSLGDVPFVQYFHRGYALHAAYWHDEFGKPRSHGCINLAPVDAAYLFEWTEPSVPPDWHGVVNKERGTPVVIRP